MGILLANLKHFHQRRGLYLVYAVCGLVALTFVRALVWRWTSGRGEFTILLVFALLIGELVSVMQMEVASKAFSFSLPGHRGAVRNLVFLAGMVTSLALSLPLVAYPELTSLGLEVPLVLISGLCANLTAYMAGLAIAFNIRNTPLVIGFVVPAAVLLSQFEAGTAIEQSVLFHPEFTILLAAMTSAAVWRWLGRPAWFRRQCAAPWVGFLDPWDRRKAHKFRQVWTARRFRKAPHPGVNAFFLERIHRCSESDPRRAAWGTLYTTATLIEPQWTGLLLLVWTAVIWAGYASRAAPFLVPVVALMLTGFINPPVYSELPVAGSRRERSFATMAQILALAGFSVLVVGLSILVLNRIMPLVPVIEIADLRLSYQPVEYRTLLPLVVVFPLMGIVRVLFHRNPMGLLLGTTLLLGSMVPAAVLAKSLPSAHIAATAGALWVVCFVVVRRIAMRSDLVRR